MPRMHDNKSTMFSGAPTGRASRYRAKKAREHVATVDALLDQNMLVDRQCFTCEAIIKCDQRPFTLPDGFSMIIPRFEAPLICHACRKDKTKFYLARRAMHVMFEWTDTHMEHRQEECHQ